jgi:hypothetical protein
VTRRVLILLLGLIVGTFVVRTWRFKHSNVPPEALEQYILDRVEIDDGFLRRAPVVQSFKIQNAGLDAELKRFTEITGVKVVIRWEALAKVGILRQAPIDSFECGPIEPLVLMQLIVISSNKVARQPDMVRYRFRHGTVEISTVGDFKADLFWRSYPVRGMLEKLWPATRDKSYIHSATYPHPANDDERLLALIELYFEGFWGLPLAGNPERMRLHDGTLELQTTREGHVFARDTLLKLEKHTRKSAAP